MKKNKTAIQGKDSDNGHKQSKQCCCAGSSQSEFRKVLVNFRFGEPGSSDVIIITYGFPHSSFYYTSFFDHQMLTSRYKLFTFVTHTYQGINGDAPPY